METRKARIVVTSSGMRTRGAAGPRPTRWEPYSDEVVDVTAGIGTMQIAEVKARELGLTAPAGDPAAFLAYNGRVRIQVWDNVDPAVDFISRDADAEWIIGGSARPTRTAGVRPADDAKVGGTDTGEEDDITDALISHVAERLHAAKAALHARPRVYSPLGDQPDDTVTVLSDGHYTYERDGGRWVHPTAEGSGPGFAWRETCLRSRRQFAS